jgi:fatty acid desaturase/predicted heme/steroid binding protein
MQGKTVAVQRSRLPFNRDESGRRGAAGKGRAKKQLSMDEVREHVARTKDVWIVIEDKVYDLTKWHTYHPGGNLPLHAMAGLDATEPFDNFHPAYVWEKKLPAFYVADVTSGLSASPYRAGHREIRQQLLKRGLFETRPSYYLGKCVWLGALLALACCCTAWGQSTSARMAGAVVLGLFWQQLAFVGHDIGHNSVTHNRAIDYVLGAANVAFFGVSMGWWKKSHNTHHVVTNSVEHDPDIQHLPVLAVSPSIFKGFFSTYHKKVFCPLLLDPVARFVICHQHLLYYVFMFFGRYNLYIQSWALLLDPNERVEMRKLEIAAMGVYWSWLSYLCSYCASAPELVAYVVLSHGVSGLLHVQITLSHFCMEHWTKEQKVYTDDSNDWFRVQLATTMDVDCPEWMDWFHGGLQFQIEHHLFPRVPRHNLREVKKLVMAYARKHGIHYHSVSFMQGNREVIAGLYETAMAAKALPRDADSITQLKESWTWEMFNARG